MMQNVTGITVNVKKIKEISWDFVLNEIEYALFSEGRKTQFGYLEKMDQVSG